MVGNFARRTGTSGLGKVFNGPRGGKSRRPDGLGLATTVLKRHRKVLRESIHGITKGSIRRLARRGGVKRISAFIYDEARVAIRARLEGLLRDISAVLDMSDRKTVHVADVVYVLNRHGTPIYGFGTSDRRLKDCPRNV